jgi:hypothetical protein
MTHYITVARAAGTRAAATIAVGITLAGLVALPGEVVAASGAAPSAHPLQPTGRIARLDRGAGVIEGKLTRVDGRTETVDVSIGLLGLLGKTIEINHDTLIQVNGREARFADLQEGAKVKAFYEERGAKLVGTRLEVTTGG